MSFWIAVIIKGMADGILWGLGKGRPSDFSLIPIKCTYMNICMHECGSRWLLFILRNLYLYCHLRTSKMNRYPCKNLKWNIFFYIWLFPAKSSDLLLVSLKFWKNTWIEMHKVSQTASSLSCSAKLLSTKSYGFCTLFVCGEQLEKILFEGKAGWSVSNLRISWSHLPWRDWTFQQVWHSRVQASLVRLAHPPTSLASCFSSS